MTTPMSLQPWWWQIFILIQLWSQFFQMFVYGDVVYAQTWYWPWKTVSSHLDMPGRPMLLQYGPHFFSTHSWSFGQLARCFWANGLPPPLAKISRTPMLLIVFAMMQLIFTCFSFVCQCLGWLVSLVFLLMLALESMQFTRVLLDLSWV